MLNPVLFVTQTDWLSCVIGDCSYSSTCQDCFVSSWPISHIKVECDFDFKLRWNWACLDLLSWQKNHFLPPPTILGNMPEKKNIVMHTRTLSSILSVILMPYIYSIKLKGRPRIPTGFLSWCSLHPDQLSASSVSLSSAFNLYSGSVHYRTRILELRMQNIFLHQYISLVPQELFKIAYGEDRSNPIVAC